MSMVLPVDYTKIHQKQRKAVREEYVRLQDGLCSHCKNSLSDAASGKVASLKINRSLFPPNFFKFPVHLHHNHETGMTIGAVHSVCNAVLWQYYGE